MNAAELRQSFFDFFSGKNHTIVPSASLMPTSPNLLFTNAGMNQFVPYFLEEEPAPFPRAADTQKCIRAGGKHNDLEDVGFDTYHHTFFEMLGNWSFGDYFKTEAIDYAWELLTKVWKFPLERLYVTVYQPDEGDPADFDAEAADHWAKVLRADGLDPARHILTGNKKDNFWMMGDTGPCGPCSEIHIDLTPAGDTAGKLVNADSPWCIEIWNLVFIQFNANEDGTLSPLPNRHIDTGMGFERVAGIIATTHHFTDFSHPPSNYNSDLFTDIFAHLADRCGHTYGYTMPEDRNHLSPIQQKDCAFRVIADHIRTLTFSIADGILPGNEGRNYVLRRILRRAVLFGRRLDLPEGFFADLAPVLIHKMGKDFPELAEQRTMITKVLQSEESTFAATLERGLQQFEKFADASEISGEAAFVLADTYGFPLDLTELLARERGIPVDANGFEVCLERQREMARAAQKREVVRVATVDESVPETRFVGFDPENLRLTGATLLEVRTEPDGDDAWAIFDQSPFYPEMGGQIGDTGILKGPRRDFRVTDTRKDKQGHILHRCVPVDPADPPILPETIPAGTTLGMIVDLERRRRIQRHHSATHILNWALRSVLGNHVRQAGSYVGPDRLRFDFSHFEAIPPHALARIENLVNGAILANSAVHWYEVPFSEKPADVIAVFGEKYGNVVRIVDIGGFSKELCGGTHVSATGEIGLCKILSETGISAGTRRIEAVCGEAAFALVSEQFATLQHIATTLACPPQEVVERFDALVEQRAGLEKELRKHAQKAAAAAAGDLASAAFDRDGLRWIVEATTAEDPNALRTLAANALGQGQGDVIVLAARIGEKTSIVATVAPKAINQSLNASSLVRQFCNVIGGKGGGKPDFAMGGGPAIDDLSSTLASVFSD